MIKRTRKAHSRGRKTLIGGMIDGALIVGVSALIAGAALVGIIMIESSMDHPIFHITKGSLSYKWLDGVNYSIHIPTGMYNVNDINRYIHHTQFYNEHYLEKNNGHFHFFVRVDLNPSHTIDVVSNLISTKLYPIGTEKSQYQYPGPTTEAPATWSVPDVETRVELIIPVLHS